MCQTVHPLLLDVSSLVACIAHGLLQCVSLVLHLSPCGSFAKQPEPYTAASPTLPSTFSAMPPEDTPDAT